MALTLTYTPPAYSSVHGDVLFTVTDADKVADPATYSQFKFIADVYVSSTMVARLKKVPDPTTGVGIFNIGQVVRNYLAMPFNPTPGAVVAQESSGGQFFVSVHVSFGEEWALTPTYNIINDISRTYFNNYNGRLIGTTSSLIAKVDKVASNRPTTCQLLSGSQYFFLPYVPSTNNPLTFIVTPTGGGSPFSTTLNPIDANELLLVNVAPSAINALHAGAITAATSSYTVQIGTQLYTVKIICEPVFQPYMIHFLNQYGGFDSKLFTKVSRKTVTATKADYGRLPYTVGFDGQPVYKSANGVYNENRSTFSSLFNEKMVLNTDLLPDAEYTWLRDLLLSPMVYIEDGGYLFPITITDTDYEARKNVNDDLTNLTVNIEFGTQQNAQFR